FKTGTGAIELRLFAKPWWYLSSITSPIRVTFESVMPSKVERSLRSVSVRDLGLSSIVMYVRREGAE
ncbi:MAG: hypothetical protein QGF77_03840, partial [Candidatus Thalassarchaeaceae archaeon]|nr:hypothetical protein [Candidatus Thalassarchaeaceae archaeon]